MAKSPPPIPKASPRIAVRDAVALVEADPQQLHAALELARYLRAEGQAGAASAVRLTEAFIARGDLPRAVLAAEAAGESMDAIAEAFGEGSKRLGDAPPAPPPLPTQANADKALRKLRGDALTKRAAAALASVHIAETSGPLPRLPLFSDLPAAPLSDLLGAFEARDLEDGDTIIVEGDEGTEAFVLAEGMLAVVRGEEGTLLAKLGPGALFGEMALVSDAPRAATVKAEGNATVLVVGRDRLEELAAATPEIGQRLAEFCRGRMVANLLRHSEVLSAVPHAERSVLIGRFATHHFDEGDSLIEAGKENDGLFLIASGAVAVEGKGVRIAELGPGEVVGEISLVLRRPANASVHAVHPTVALRLSRDDFQSVIRDHPTLLTELYDVATQRDEETRSLVAVEAVDGEEVVLV